MFSAMEVTDSERDMIYRSRMVGGSGGKIVGSSQYDPHKLVGAEQEQTQAVGQQLGNRASASSMLRQRAVQMRLRAEAVNKIANLLEQSEHKEMGETKIRQDMLEALQAILV